MTHVNIVRKIIPMNLVFLPSKDIISTLFYLVLNFSPMWIGFFSFVATKFSHLKKKILSIVVTRFFSLVVTKFSPLTSLHSGYIFLHICRLKQIIKP